MSEIEIPFGAFDSELVYKEITIPDGFEATIEGKKIILKRKESEDERIRKALFNFFDEANKVDVNPMYEYGIPTDKIISWLEKQRMGE